MNKNFVTKGEKQKTDKAKYFYMLLMFLWCAYTAPFLKPFDSSYLITSAFYIIIYLIYFFKFCSNRKQKALYVSMGIMLVWYAAQCFKVGNVTNIDFRLVYSIVLCHVSFYLYRGREFFLYFEKVLELGNRMYFVKKAKNYLDKIEKINLETSSDEVEYS